MDLKTRADKIAEIWKQLSWLEAQVTAAGSGPFILGDSQLTLADITWFPTFVFMEYMLPRIFGWPEIFKPDTPTPFPRLATWYTYCRETDEAFASTHADIWRYWVEMEAIGQFKPIQQELESSEAAGLKFTYGISQRVLLNYQSPPPPGYRTGRYINQDDQGDVVDEHQPVCVGYVLVEHGLCRDFLLACILDGQLILHVLWMFVQVSVFMNDGREISPPARLDSHGFALSSCPSAVTDWHNEEHVKSIYYPEMCELVAKALPGASAERICVFDHTIRESGNTNLNADAGVYLFTRTTSVLAHLLHLWLIAAL